MRISRGAVRFLSSVFGFYWFALSPVTAAQPIPGSSLEDFFSAAIEFSPTLQIASENLNISSARRQAAYGSLLPQLNAGANVSDNNLEQYNNRQNFTGERYFVALTQTLFNWQQFAARKQANLLEDQSEEEYYYQLLDIKTYI